MMSQRCFAQPIKLCACHKLSRSNVMPCVQPHVMQLLTGVFAIAADYDKNFVLTHILRSSAHKAMVYAYFCRCVLTPYALIFEGVLRIHVSIELWHAIKFKMLYFIICTLDFEHQFCSFLLPPPPQNTSAVVGNLKYRYGSLVLGSFPHYVRPVDDGPQSILANNQFAPHLLPKKNVSCLVCRAWQGFLAGLGSRLPLRRDLTR